MNEDETQLGPAGDSNDSNGKNPIASGAEKIGRKAKDEILKKAKKKAGAKAAAKASLGAAMGPIIFWGTIVIVCIIILVGIIMFFATMPGMVMEKLKALGKGIAKAISSWFGADSTKFVDDETINTSLDYLEEMGYDLKGYGFLTGYTDTKDGVKRNDAGKIEEAHSDFLKTYYISDNYVYTVKNDNLATDSIFEAIARHFVDFFGGSLGENWTRGLIALYREYEESGKGVLGRRGSFYSSRGAFNGDDMKIDTENKTLSLRKGRGATMRTYNLDGWTGRYGMPVDFLISVHLATMMPDLAYDMANSFETEIIMLLHVQTYAVEVNTGKPKEDIEPVAVTKPNLETGTAKAVAVDSTVEEPKREFEDKHYYLPYVESVKDHWYRNVYYVINKANTAEYKKAYNKDNIEFVKYDFDYEVLMKERWTLYKTYSKEESEEKEGEFKYYALNSTGNYATSEEEIENYSPEFFVKEEETGYFLFLGSITEQKKALQGEKDVTRYNIARMAETIDASNEVTMNDLGWDSTTKDDDGTPIWTVYKKNSTENAISQKR